MNMRNIRLPLALLLFPLALAAQTPTVLMNSDVDWGQAHWSAGQPAAQSVAVITNGRTVIHSAGTTPLHSLRIGNNDAGGMLRLNGGDLHISHNLQLGTTGEGRSAVVHRGGAVKTNRVMLASNNSAKAFAAYGIAAGSLEFNQMDVGTVGSAVFSVLGSAPERVSGMNLLLRGGVNSGLEFILDAKGVRTIELSGRFELGESSSIRVDGTHFKGDDAEIILVQARAFSGQLDPQKIVFTNFPDGLTPSLKVLRQQLVLRIQRP